MVELDLFPREKFRGVLADASAPLPFRDASFDAVVSMEGTEHFENQATFLRECARVLRRAGKLILASPNVLTSRRASRASGPDSGSSITASSTR